MPRSLDNNHILSTTGFYTNITDVLNMLPRISDELLCADCTNFIPYKDGYLIHWGFASFAVKYLAVECFFKKNTYGIKFYEKLSGIQKNGFKKRFKPVIESFESYGFSKDKANIHVQLPSKNNKQGTLINGSHTITCCVYFKIRNIYCREVTCLAEGYSKSRCLENGIPQIITEDEKILLDNEIKRVENIFFDSII